MQPLMMPLRKPIEREGAELYLFLLLISFAASVALTRLFLELTGYPQLGNQTLHIAHVLWGGLLLFLSALVMLVFANRWVFRLGAVLAGLGVGLFMDEVGKFITQSNDYFYPPAATIIYAFFLLVVIFYMEVRKPNRRDARHELYGALDAFEEVLERDLDTVERTRLEERLHYIVENAEYYEYANLAEDLLQFIQSKHIHLVARRPSRFERVFEALTGIDERWLTRKRLKAILVGGLSVLGLWAMYDLTRWLLASGSPAPEYLVRVLLDQITNARVTSTTGLAWLTGTKALKAGCGLALLAGVGLWLARRETLALRLLFFILLLFLTVVNLLEFYFEQFSTIVPATIELILLLFLIHYRRRFLRETPGQERKL